MFRELLDDRAGTGHAVLRLTEGADPPKTNGAASSGRAIRRTNMVTSFRRCYLPRTVVIAAGTRCTSERRISLSPVRPPRPATGCMAPPHGRPGRWCGGAASFPVAPAPGVVVGLRTGRRRGGDLPGRAGRRDPLRARPVQRLVDRAGVRARRARRAAPALHDRGCSRWPCWPGGPGAPVGLVQPQLWWTAVAAIGALLALAKLVQRALGGEGDLRRRDAGRRRRPHGRGLGRTRGHGAALGCAGD